MWRKTTFGHCSCLAAATAWAAFRRLVLRVADLGSLGPVRAGPTTNGCTSRRARRLNAAKEMSA
jgi:hypothetical protein